MGIENVNYKACHGLKVYGQDWLQIVLGLRDQEKALLVISCQ